MAAITVTKTDNSVSITKADQTIVTNAGNFYALLDKRREQVSFIVDDKPILGAGAPVASVSIDGVDQTMSTIEAALADITAVAGGSGGGGITEGVLQIPSKFFNPVDDGAGNLVIEDVTLAELNSYASKYELGLYPVAVDQSVITFRVTQLIINDAVAYFDYNFLKVNGDSLERYQISISGTEQTVRTLRCEKTVYQIGQLPVPFYLPYGNGIPAVIPILDSGLNFVLTYKDGTFANGALVASGADVSILRAYRTSIQRGTPESTLLPAQSIGSTPVDIDESIYSDGSDMSTTRIWVSGALYEVVLEGICGGFAVGEIKKISTLSRLQEPDLYNQSFTIEGAASTLQVYKPNDFGSVQSAIPTFTPNAGYLWSIIDYSSNPISLDIEINTTTKDREVVYNVMSTEGKTMVIQLTQRPDPSVTDINDQTHTIDNTAQSIRVTVPSEWGYRIAIDREIPVSESICSDISNMDGSTLLRIRENTTGLDRQETIKLRYNYLAGGDTITVTIIQKA